MKLLTGKWCAGLLSLAMVMGTMAGCAQPADEEAPSASTGAADDTGSTTGDSAAEVPDAE